MMELVLTLPINKPPFIGVFFDDEFSATHKNQVWINQYNIYPDWGATIQVEGVLVKLTVYHHKRDKFRRTYEIYKYNLEELKKFLEVTKGLKRINFGHVVKNFDGSYRMAITDLTKTKFALPLSELIFLE